MEGRDYTMRRRFQATAILAVALGFSAPAAAQLSSSQDPSSSSTGAGSAAATAKTPSKKLLKGMEQLHAVNQAEIQAGQIAQQKASSADVKAFGEKMVTEHTQNDQHLSGMAQTLGVNLEGKAYQKQQKGAQKTAKKLEGKTGSAFDAAYIDAMVKGHEKVAKNVKKLSDQARKDGQSELASFLDQTVQGVQGHLSIAKKIQSSMRTASKSSSSTGSSTGQ
jgi:putative membrane protein